jgi:hypothetical protein
MIGSDLGVHEYPTVGDVRAELEDGAVKLHHTLIGKDGVKQPAK